MPSPSSHPKYLLGVALVLLATVGWSLAGVFVRFLPALDGWQINCWRGLSVSIFLFLYLIAAHGRDWHRRFSDIPFPALAACAGFFALGSTLYVTSLTLTSTANVSCIGAMAPLFVAAASYLAVGERPAPATWFAAVLALLGVILIFRDGLDSGNWLGSAVAVAVAASFAAQTLILRRYRSYDMMAAICIGGLLAFFLAGIFGGGLTVPFDHIAVLALMGLLQLAIPLVLFARGARYVQATTLSLIALSDAVLNPFWAWVGVGERASFEALVGGAIILGAVTLSIIVGRRFDTYKKTAGNFAAGRRPAQTAPGRKQSL